MSNTLYTANRSKGRGCPRKNIGALSLGEGLGLHGEECPRRWLCGEDERRPAGFHGRCRGALERGWSRGVVPWLRACGAESS
jgi:hypothetical protein